MPGYKTHFVGGILTAALVLGVLYYFNWELPLSSISFALLSACIYGLLPDVDIRTSKIFLLWSIIVTGSMLIFTLRVAFKGLPETQIIIAMAGLAALYFLSLFARHRGFFHKYTTGMIFAIPVWLYFGMTVGIAALSAYWSHLILDKVRPDG